MAVPSAIKVFNWTATMYKGSIYIDTPMLYAFGFIGLFTMGGLTGLFLRAWVRCSRHRHLLRRSRTSTYVMVGGMVMAYLGGMHFWWPKITGRMYPEAWARLAAIIMFAGFNLTFFPQFILGYLGMPRRYHAYPEIPGAERSFEGRSIRPCGWISAAPDLFPLVAAVRRDRRDNPWDAAGLEWETTSPPPTYNFHEVPVVTEDPYAYGEEAVISGH